MDLFNSGAAKQHLHSKRMTTTFMNEGQFDKLEKAGEGSRGGKIIGHTKSGKAVYESKGMDKPHGTENYTPDDHRDASVIHGELYGKHSRKAESTPSRLIGMREGDNKPNPKWQEHIETRDHHDQMQVKHRRAMRGEVDNNFEEKENHDIQGVPKIINHPEHGKMEYSHTIKGAQHQKEEHYYKTTDDNKKYAIQKREGLNKEDANNFASKKEKTEANANEANAMKEGKETKESEIEKGGHGSGRHKGQFVSFKNNYTGVMNHGVIHSSDEDGKYHKVRTTVGNMDYVADSDLKEAPQHMHEKIKSKMREKKYADGKSYYDDFEEKNDNKIFDNKETVKNYLDDLLDIKKGGGEGSRGGKVIGHTKSGKAVYADKTPHHEDYKNFNSADHSDAVDIHNKLAQKYKKENNSEKENQHASLLIDHDFAADDAAEKEEKRNLGNNNHKVGDKIKLYHDDNEYDVKHVFNSKDEAENSGHDVPEDNPKGGKWLGIKTEHGKTAVHSSYLKQ